MTSQYIRRTIFTTEGTLPWINNRSFIVDKEVIELTPIENATETIRGQTADMDR